MVATVMKTSGSMHIVTTMVNEDSRSSFFPMPVVLVVHTENQFSQLTNEIPTLTECLRDKRLGIEQSEPKGKVHSREMSGTSV